MPTQSSDIAEISCVNFLVLFLPLDQYPRFRCTPICQDCGSNFPLLKTDVCNKCRMLEGQSPVEGFKPEFRLLLHQVLGRAWMKDREDVSKKQTGGILTDDMVWVFISNFTILSFLNLFRGVSKRPYRHLQELSMVMLVNPTKLTAGVL